MPGRAEASSLEWTAGWSPSPASQRIRTVARFRGWPHAFQTATTNGCGPCGKMDPENVLWWSSCVTMPVPATPGPTRRQRALRRPVAGRTPSASAAIQRCRGIVEGIRSSSTICRRRVQPRLPRPAISSSGRSTLAICRNGQANRANAGSDMAPTSDGPANSVRRRRQDCKPQPGPNRHGFRRRTVGNRNSARADADSGTTNRANSLLPGARRPLAGTAR